MDGQLRRRRFLVIAGAATATGLAGCTGSAPSNDDATDAPATEEAHDETTEAEDDHDDEGEDHEEDGGHGDDGHGDAVGEPSDHAEVSMISTDDGEHFDPHVVRVNVGGSVTWHLESGTHSTTAYHLDNDRPQLVPDGAASWDSGILTEEGKTFEHTFETEGVYHYYCTPHETLGMLGSVIVGEPEAHGQPALEEPPADLPDTVREKLTELNEMVNGALGEEH